MGLCTYNLSCILQMHMCRETLINKDIEYRSYFFVVPGNRPALLGMPECESMQLQSINCHMTNDPHRKR